MRLDDESKDDHYRFNLKIAVLGNEGVGKTSIINYSLNFNPNQSTTSTMGAMFMNKNLQVDGQNYSLQIWDTAGQERFRNVASLYYRDAHGIVLCFDLTNRKTYDEMAFWFDEIMTKCEKKISVILVGNKLDLAETQRKVTFTEASEYAESRKSRYMEVSARTGKNIESIFEALVRDIERTNLAEDMHSRNKSSTTVRRMNGKKPKKEDNCSC